MPSTPRRSPPHPITHRTRDPRAASRLKPQILPAPNDPNPICGHFSTDPRSMFASHLDRLPHIQQLTQLANPAQQPRPEPRFSRLQNDPNPIFGHLAPLRGAPTPPDLHGLQASIPPAKMHCPTQPASSVSVISGSPLASPARPASRARRQFGYCLLEDRGARTPGESRPTVTPRAA
jgi:hypothetical protein